MVKPVRMAGDLAWKRTRRSARGVGKTGPSQVPGRPQEGVVVAALRVVVPDRGRDGRAEGRGITAGTGRGCRSRPRCGRSIRGGSQGVTDRGGAPASRRLRRMALLRSERRHQRVHGGLQGPQVNGGRGRGGRVRITLSIGACWLGDGQKPKHRAKQARLARGLASLLLTAENSSALEAH